MAWTEESRANFAKGVDDAEEYLRSGGLGEVVGFTFIAVESGNDKVSSDADLIIALCRIAQSAIDTQVAA